MAAKPGLNKYDAHLKEQWTKYEAPSKQHKNRELIYLRRRFKAQLREKWEEKRRREGWNPKLDYEKCELQKLMYSHNPEVSKQKAITKIF